VEGVCSEFLVRDLAYARSYTVRNAGLRASGPRGRPQQREYAFWHEGAGISLELQWEIIPRYFSFFWDFISLRERSQRVSLGGGDVSTFVPEDLMLVLCVHGSKHLWERLFWLCDLGETVDLFLRNEPGRTYGKG
jgi:hypothetical protein